MQALIEKKITVSLLGRDIEIKPLTLKQTICLGNFMAEIYENVKGREEEFKNTNILTFVLKNCAPAQADMVINILSNFSFDACKNLSSKITLEDTAALVNAVSTVNDFEGLAANFKSALERLKI
ncbi:hypothetical protein Dip510_001934 [Elusimicrobium posterum]|uniref:hypothetical protein n=1 Tax=Elusimicrobium posterum TaxID=3116653 RepID=UPI003C70E136